MGGGGSGDSFQSSRLSARNKCPQAIFWRKSRSRVSTFINVNLFPDISVYFNLSKHRITFFFFFFFSIVSVSSPDRSSWSTSSRRRRPLPRILLAIFLASDTRYRPEYSPVVTFSRGFPISRSPTRRCSSTSRFSRNVRDTSNGRGAPDSVACARTLADFFRLIAIPRAVSGADPRVPFLRSRSEVYPPLLPPMRDLGFYALDELLIFNGDAFFFFFTPVYLGDINLYFTRMCVKIYILLYVVFVSCSVFVLFYISHEEEEGIINIDF